MTGTSDSTGRIKGIAREGQTQDTLGDLIASLDARLRWLSNWTVHGANRLRAKRDGLKARGHQTSCASISLIMPALYLHTLRPNDEVAVKPHAGPLLPAIHHVLGG